MADPSTEDAILSLLEEDDAEGLGYTVATIATKLWGFPHNPVHAHHRHARIEVMVESLLEHGRLQVAGYLYLEESRVPRYKLPDLPPSANR